MQAIYPMGEHGLAVFVLVTLVIAGAAAAATGRAIALTWQPLWKLALYVLLLTFAARFIHYALFAEPFLTPGNVLVDYTVLAIIALTGYRLTRANRMTRQYPWLFSQSGLFGWRKIQ